LCCHHDRDGTAADPGDHLVRRGSSDRHPGDAHAACHRPRRHRGVYLTCAFFFLAGGAMALLMLGELAVPGM
jgi:hypothetical protein